MTNSEGATSEPWDSEPYLERRERDLDTDMGDDDQADDIAAYRRSVEDPEDDRRIRYRENDDDGRLGISQELDEEWTPRREAAEEADDDERPAEAAAMEILDDTDPNL